MLRIPFQDTRDYGNRRWPDVQKWQQLRVDDIKDLIDHNETLKFNDLIELRAIIERRLEIQRTSD